MSDLNQTAGVFRDPTRPLHTKGGPPGYVEKSLAAAAEPFKGNYYRRNRGSRSLLD